LLNHLFSHSLNIKNKCLTTCDLPFFIGLCLAFCLSLSFSNITHAAEAEVTEDALEVAQENQRKQLTNQTIATLLNFIQLQDQLRDDLKELQKRVKASPSETEQKDLNSQIEQAEEKLKETELNIENIAADTDLELLRNNEEEPFDLQKELLSLLEPAMKEMKDATSDVRLKAELRERIQFFTEREPIAREALKNISQLNRANDNEEVKEVLIKMNKTWSKQLVFIQSELQAKELQLEKILSQESSEASQSESIFKNFFQRRGWTLIEALLSIIAVFVISRLVLKLMMSSIKGYRAEHRGVQLRVIDLLHRLITGHFLY